MRYSHHRNNELQGRKHVSKYMRWVTKESLDYVITVGLSEMSVSNKCLKRVNKEVFCHNLPCNT